MVSRVGKWGGSLSVRLPKNIVELLAISAGDFVRVRLGDDNAIHVKAVKAAPDSAQATPPTAREKAEEQMKW